MIKKLFIFLMLAGSTVAYSQSTPIKLVVPYSPGGPNDVLAKIVQTTLSQELSTPIVIEYKVGAQGEIANSYVANSNKSETVLLLNSVGWVTNLAVKKPSYKVENLIPVVYLGSMPLVLTVPKKSNLTTIQDWIQSNRSITYGSAGVGTTTHLAGATLQKTLKKNMLHVPYKGIGQAIPDLLAGHIDSAFIFAPIAQQYYDTNMLVPVAVMSDHRLPKLPNVPTFKEYGINELNNYTWFVILSNTNDPKIQQALLNILNDPNKRKPFEDAGLIIPSGDKRLTTAWVDQQVIKYARILRNLNISTD